MLERRRKTRDRVYYGGLIAFNARSSTASCIVRNFSLAGARLQLDASMLVPDVMDIIIENRKVAFVAEVIWRRDRDLGVAFRERIHSSGETPLDWSIRLRGSERARRRLQERLNRLTGY